MAAAADKTRHLEYILGSDDQLRIWALGVDEITERPQRIDSTGHLDLPIVGRVRAAGMTLEELRGVLLKRLAREVREPQVSVEVVAYGSQPVSVLGSVGTPGVFQLQGRRNLVEVLSMAGGLRNDAGNRIKITRAVSSGPLPLTNSKLDPTGNFATAEISIQDLLAANDPTQNILMRPHDTVTIPTADVIYVLGAVKKPGAFVINARQNISVLQALSMAEGLGLAPAPKNSRILRDSGGNAQRAEIPIDVNKIMANRAEDLALKPNDVLFIPNSAQKKVAVRALEAIVQAGTGIAIFRRP